MLDTVYVSFDDTDSDKGLCTTYLATEIIDKIDLDLIGYPRLVRLNPAVPWKTRGNGSVSLRFGVGRGNKKEIGEINGKKIFAFTESEKNSINNSISKSKLLKTIIPIIERNRDPNSNSGIIVSKEKPDPSLYWKGVRYILERNEIIDVLDEIDAEYHEFGNGRGLIGSACGMAWSPEDKTYEYIAYRFKEKWGSKRVFEKNSVRKMNDVFPSTFNNWEERTEKASIFPGTPCPVLYGIRGDSSRDLPKAASLIETEPVDRNLIFLTNQGTDDHIIEKFNPLSPLSSYYVEGYVTGIKKIPGGHIIFGLSTKYGDIDCTVYEPAKTFRNAISWLYPGDLVGVMGELRNDPRTLNVEKLKVISLSKEFEKISNPVCDECNKRMESVGKDKGYRCRDCKTSAPEAIFEEKVRWIVPGWYEPPSSARRHLSKPLKRMGIEQSVYFVNSRT